MTKTVALQCECGELKGHVQVVPKSFFHVHCLCCDCQKLATHLGSEARVLDEHGGSELFQTYPEYMQITEGQDQIACLRLSEKGLYRWYTRCCNTPIANTMTSWKMPFVGMSVKLMQFADEQEKQAVLGPVSLKAFGKYAKGDMPEDVHATFPKSYMPKVLAFMLKGALMKKNTPSPFFNGDKLVAKAEVLT